jgi:hypothetical protein
MSNDKKINLDLTVAEQIATAQLMIIRDAALMRPLSLEECRILEILVKTKNTEEERRKPTEDESDEMKRINMLKALALSAPENLVEFKKKEDEPKKPKVRRKKSD